MMYISL